MKNILQKKYKNKIIEVSLTLFGTDYYIEVPFSDIQDKINFNYIEDKEELEGIIIELINNDLRVINISNIRSLK